MAEASQTNPKPPRKGRTKRALSSSDEGTKESDGRGRKTGASKGENDTKKEERSQDLEEEEELDRLAAEAILQEAKRGRARAEYMGATGWQKCSLPRANKRFLATVVTSAVSSNKRRKLEGRRAGQPGRK